MLHPSSQHVGKTTHQGQAWDKIRGDLTRHDPKTMQDSGGPITHDMNSPEIYATVFALAPGKTDVNLIWAGSDDGLVQLTRDGGKNWTNITPKDMPDLGRISQIDASTLDAGTAYIAVKKPLLMDFSPCIFRPHAFGRPWTQLVPGIPPTAYSPVVPEAPARRRRPTPDAEVRWRAGWHTDCHRLVRRTTLRRNRGGPPACRYHQYGDGARFGNARRRLTRGDEWRPDPDGNLDQ